jgi:hypothetical protein
MRMTSSKRCFTLSVKWPPNLLYRWHHSTPSVEGEPISTDDLNENEARLKQIEAVYAAAEREDINEISQPVLPDAEHGPPVSTPPHDH